ncbi:hypothetical protein [Brevibacillus sp. MER 51]|uniref:hypothetical protein n=1 Tax=Brevibacillus sp. MER 51 TaxID=2939560 RepID=UPI0020410A3E|nr:hypothetical protein [Brevibacillus sp. MER 51]MCM3144486.1 hypothetical protein [Brevibacillus sp. MER 51]
MKLKSLGIGYQNVRKTRFGRFLNQVSDTTSSGGSECYKTDNGGDEDVTGCSRTAWAMVATDAPVSVKIFVAVSISTPFYVSIKLSFYKRTVITTTARHRSTSLFLIRYFMKLVWT